MRQETQGDSARSARRSLFRRFGRDRRGGVGSEFSLLVFPFAFLVFATLESCISFAAQELLANATDDVARMIRTGQVKAAAISEGSLKKMICDRIQIVVPSGCPDLEVDLREFTSFEEAAKVKVVVTNKELNKSDFAVTPGKSMTKNMLRVFYRWPAITDIMAKSVSVLNDNKTLFFSSVTWQNEPFDD